MYKKGSLDYFPVSVSLCYVTTGDSLFVLVKILYLVISGAEFV